MANAGTTTCDEALRQRRKALVEEHADAEDRHDLDATMATFRRPRYEIIPTGEVFDGEEEVRRMHAYNWRAFPDFRSEHLALHHFDDGIVDESWLRGTHLGEFHGLPPTGRLVRFRVIALFLFEDDGLVCERVYYDTLEVMRGLGVSRDPMSSAGQAALVFNHPVVFTGAALRWLRQRGGS
jgi:predicted ester cyclase